MPDLTSLAKFYKKTRQERIDTLEQAEWISEAQARILRESLGLSDNTASHMIENQLSLYQIPYGIALNFVINGKPYLIPMATEEPSVIAAASNAAKLVSLSSPDGFVTESLDRQMVGQIALTNVTEPDLAMLKVQKKEEELLTIANLAHPSIVKRGGGATSIQVKWIPANESNPDSFLVVYLTVDTKEAMGANMLNTMLESLVVPLETLTGGHRLMAILSNYASQSLVRATCVVKPQVLASATYTGELVRDKIISASNFARADIYRATTHNKGIMNGIDALVLASGNDWRAIEAGAHAYASQSGSYQPLATWSKDKDGNLVGEIVLPVPIGTVGGSIAIHPMAQLSHQLLGNPQAKELAQIIGALGLAQNLAALKALVTVGIQKGHMSLQAKSLLIACGATDEEIEPLTEALLKEPHLNQETAMTLLKAYRG